MTGISPKRIAIIGAGASGLTAIKCCKDEGFAVTCYEKTNQFGGRWCFRECSIPGVASVMKSTISLSSKEMNAFSDFPPPKHFPNYLHHTRMMEYLTLYAAKYDLKRHIKFQHDVTNVTEADNHADNGKWLVTFLNEENCIEVEEFDGVMVCSGRLSYPSVPMFPNQDSFEGIKIHTHYLKRTSTFENLNVLVVGSGNSAIEAAVEISILAKQVYLSMRNGCRLFPKLGPRGLPSDMMRLRRHLLLLNLISSKAVDNYMVRNFERGVDHEIFKIKPRYSIREKHPTLSDDLLDKILTGRICIKGTVKKFEKNNVLFEGDEGTTEINAVVFGTGYDMKIPFLNENFYLTDRVHPNLYKGVFPVGLRHFSLAFIGFVESQGPTLPISESQSRWVSRILAKKTLVPTDEAVSTYMQSKLAKISETNQLTEDYMQYMDDLAAECGVKPNMLVLLFKDFRLFWCCLMGPYLPYQFRLTGPHSWSLARAALLECYERVYEPLDTVTRKI